ncbi:YbeD family protein [soil metagenome]
MSSQNTEELLQFPCDFPIKIVGMATTDFEDAVLAIIHKHVPGLDQTAISSRPSAGGRYLAITVIVPAQSKAQLDALYSELSSCKYVIMAL